MLMALFPSALLLLLTGFFDALESKISLLSSVAEGKSNPPAAMAENILISARRDDSASSSDIVLLFTNKTSNDPCVSLFSPEKINVMMSWDI